MPNPIEILAKGGKSLLKKAAEGKAAVEDLAKDGVKAGKGAVRSSRSAAKNLLEDSHSLSFRQNVPHAEVKYLRLKLYLLVLENILKSPFQQSIVVALSPLRLSQ